MKKGRAAAMTHDYKRNGTTTLFAALDILNGEVIGQRQARHTHVEWLKFLRQIDRQTPKDKALHLIADNYATHQHPAVQKWLAKHPRFVMHFTSTSASWLNMVEGFFRDITVNRLRRGVFTSVPELVSANDGYIAHHSTKPKPFIWTKSAADILQKVIRANSRLSSQQNALRSCHAPRLGAAWCRFAPTESQCVGAATLFHERGQPQAQGRERHQDGQHDHLHHHERPDAAEDGAQADAG